MRSLEIISNLHLIASACSGDSYRQKHNALNEMIQDDPGTFWVRLADSVNHTKYPVVILTTDHQIKTGEIVPLRVDQLVVFCPPKESPSTSFARSNKNIQTLSKTGNHAPNTSPGPLGPLRKCLGWSQWQSGRCDARLQTVCSPPSMRGPLGWRMHRAIHPFGLQKNEGFYA